MGTTKHREPEECDGGPLAVCVNDCQLDYGQASSELIRICFQVRCAFAEMRWGRAAAAAFEAGTLMVDEKQPTPRQYS
jgi:hypothetical protein